MAPKLSLFWKIFVLSFTIIPVCIIANRFIKFLVARGFHSAFIAMTGFSVMGIYLTIIIFTCKYNSSKEKITNWHFYAFSLFAATSVLDFGLALEGDGYISGFISEYLRSGEPYLFSPFGSAICYFDGFAMYLMYLYMIHAITNDKSYRSVGIYWCGTLVFSLVVMFLGILWGKHGLFPATFLNAPYLIVPVVIGWQLLLQRPALETTKTPHLSLHKRPLDVVLVVFLIIAAFIALLRGTAVMENNVSVAKYYIDKIEPFLMMDDPSPFIKIQVLLYLLYFLPVYLLSIYGLIVPGCSWMLDLTLFHAGAMAQGQFSAIGTAFNSGIPKQFQIPQTQEAQTVFWLVNLLLPVLPHLLLARCYVGKDFFKEFLSKTNRSAGKAKNN